MLRNRNLLSRRNAKIEVVQSVFKMWVKILWLTFAGAMCRLDISLCVIEAMTIKTLMGW